MTYLKDLGVNGRLESGVKELVKELLCDSEVFIP